MSDPYRKDFPYDEFHPDLGWQSNCTRTLSHQVTGRSDWTTIGTFYHLLHAPVGLANAGPSGLPLAVTQIREITPTETSTALQDPVFYLSEAGERVQPGIGARAFLFHSNEGEDWITDLGRPTLDRVLARGARPGDRLCVYEMSPAAASMTSARLGCEDPITEDDELLALETVEDWQPDVIISPVTSRTIAISVTNVPTGWSLSARLFPATDPAPPAIALGETGGEHAGVFDLGEPAMEGYVRVWVTSPTAPLREIVTDYAIGGNPGHVRGADVSVRGRWGHVRGADAPALSADGQVILFGRDLAFEEGELITLQAATVVPSPLPWATVVGQAYRLSASASVSDTSVLTDASISFSYMGNEVPCGGEEWLRVYFWDEDADEPLWRQLPTNLDAYHNNASAPAQGEGLYALMSSIEIPLYAPGWNLISYPVPGTRPVTEALQSIEGHFSTVYCYDVRDTVDPWKMYDVTVPDWVNDLRILEFAHGYWISATDAVTWYLREASAPATFDVGDLQGALSMPAPPATYYGPVLSGRGVTPTAGMTVTAWVGHNPCGWGRTLEIDDQVVYSINVFADGTGEVAGCGAPGRRVAFRVDSRIYAPAAAWNNGQVWELALRPAGDAYLPVVLKNRR
jgi:hypothetical protein